MCKVKENKHLREGVLEYAAQENVKFDAEIVQKGRFGMKTSLLFQIQQVGDFLS